MPEHTNDALVVQMVLNGDPEAFEQIVQRYHDPLRRLAMVRTCNADLADDIVQETFLAAYRSLHTYKPEYGFLTWLWTILINQCRRATKKQCKLPVPLSVAAPDSATSPKVSRAPQPEDVAECVERWEHLQDLLARLPETRGDAVRLRFFGELKYQEIAETLGCSLSAAKKWVREGLVAMSELMRDTNSPYCVAERSVDPNKS